MNIARHNADLLQRTCCKKSLPIKSNKKKEMFIFFLPKSVKLLIKAMCKNRTLAFRHILYKKKNKKTTSERKLRINTLQLLV